MAGTTTPAATKGMVAVGKRSRVKALGYIIWFSIPEQSVSVKVFKRVWMTRGLPVSVLPEDPSAIDTFKRAMREQEGRARNPDGTITQTDVVDVLESTEEVVYQISRVVRDIDNKEVDYPKAMRVTWNKWTEEVKFRPFKDTPAADLLPMTAAIQAYMEEKAKVLEGRKVRELVRRFVHDDPKDGEATPTGLSGENMRGKGGGVYFVEAEYKPLLDKLADTLAALYPNHGAYLYSVPMADGASEREMLRRHHQDNTLKEISEAMAEIQTKLLRPDRKHGVRVDVAQHHYQRLAQLRARAEKYKGLLRGESQEVTAAIGLMEAQLKKLPLAQS